MKLFISIIVFLLLIGASLAQDACASTGGPYLWLSTDPNNFNSGGTGYVNTASGWQDHSYVAKSMPFTMYLYNSAYGNTGTPNNIGLMIVVHRSDTSGSITIADAFGVQQTLTYANFTNSAAISYPDGDHSGVYTSDGVYAILKPSQTISLGVDYNGQKDTASTANSWTKFVVVSSSFSEVHFDALSAKDCNGNNFYTSGSHDIDLAGRCGGVPPVPEPASICLFMLGLAGFAGSLRKTKRGT